MRTPTSWNDRDLLEIDPFASTFYARQLSPPGRRGLNAWIKQFAQEIQNTPDHRAAAERWVEYAFTADGTPHSLGPPLNGIEVFVRFYWTWYSNGEEAAAKVVNDERRDRGFGYRLPAIRPLGDQAQETRITAGPECVSAPSPGPSCPRKRPQKKRQKRQTIAPAAQKTQGIFIDVEDNATNMPAVQHTNDVDVCVDSGSSHVADFAREQADIEEDESKDVFVFAGDEDLDVFMQLNLPTPPALSNNADVQQSPDGHYAQSTIKGNLGDTINRRVGSPWWQLVQPVHSQRE
ncbi:hypothetical protein BD413DRAFT_616602 [Trametes elegans]|nr:hypothetical protein BD413DRAFT_616602 [Trametes elegans]